LAKNGPHGVRTLQSLFKHILFIVICLLTSCELGVAQVIERKDFHPNPEGMPGEELYEKEIPISDDLSLHARVEVTAKEKQFRLAFQVGPKLD